MAREDLRPRACYIAGAGSRLSADQNRRSTGPKDRPFARRVTDARRRSGIGRRVRSRGARGDADKCEDPCRGGNRSNRPQLIVTMAPLMTVVPEPSSEAEGALI